MPPKRKLSDLDSSPSSASSSTYSRDSLSPSPSQHAFNFQITAHTAQQFPRPQFAWPREEMDVRHASGRTRKRLRDNRPDEQAIYANTFRKLFDAQRSYSNQHSQTTDGHVPPTSLPDAMDMSDGAAELRSELNLEPQPKSQSSLHKFFNISRAPTSNAMPATHLQIDASSTKCQDCETSMGDGDDMMMDEGCGSSKSAWGCRRCGRTVCDLCAVVDFAGGRECLMCRTG